MFLFSMFSFGTVKNIKVKNVSVWKTINNITNKCFLNVSRALTQLQFYVNDISRKRFHSFRNVLQFRYISFDKGHDMLL